jgi:hypothetical protein
MSIALKSDGFMFGDVYIPPFNLYEGNYVVLNYDAVFDFQKDYLLREILSASKKNDAIQTSFLFVSLYEPWTYESRSFVNYGEKTVENYLLDVKLMTNVKGICERLGLKPKMKLNTLAGTDKKLLAIEAAYSKTSHIVLNTAGIDPLGIERVYNRLEEEIIKGGTVIEIEYSHAYQRAAFKDEITINAKNNKKLQRVSQ